MWKFFYSNLYSKSTVGSKYDQEIFYPETKTKGKIQKL